MAWSLVTWAWSLQLGIEFQALFGLTQQVLKAFMFKGFSLGGSG